jgi:hypothetical protein
MADLHGFDANKVDPSTGFDPIPAGRYVAMVTDSELKPTKSGDGRYLQLTFQILDGEFKNRYVWARLNLENRNETAVKIARAELSSLCRATGIMTPRDSCELHGVPLIVTVRCKKDKETGEVTNEIRGFAKKDSLPGQPQQVTPSTPPWRR